MSQVEMEFSALPEGYRRAFTKRLQERAVGIDAKPSGLNKEEQEGYNDADLAFLAKNSVNASVKSKSAKYRKAYHKALYDAATGSPDTAASDNAEIEQARQNAKRKINDPEFIPDLMNQKVLEQLANVELAAPKAEPEELVFNESGEVTSLKVIAQKSSDCETLFDPCTKEPLADLAALEKRVRELRVKQAADANTRMELPVEINTRLDLLLMILNNTSPPNISLLQYKRAGQTGQIFEAYWDIVFAMGLVSKYPVTKNFYMYNGNIDGIASMEDIKLVQNALLYLQTRRVNMGASGASDITFVYKNNKESIVSDPCSHTTIVETKKPKFIFCSSKFYKSDKEKSIDKYDIQNIYTSAKNLHTDYDYDIVLLVQDTKAVKDKIKTAIRQYISEEASNVFGTDDLIASLRKLYDFVHTTLPIGTPITKEDLSNLFGIKAIIKPFLSLRLHQEIAVQKIAQSVKIFQSSQTGNNKFLVGILPRGGKTYIAGGLVRELQPQRVVVLLGAKSETLEQFKDDLFEEFQDFADYTILDVKEETPVFEIDLGKKYIFIMSVELYKTQSTSRQLLINLKSEGVNKADLFICDEAHLKQVTARADIEMQKGTKIQEEKQLQEVDNIITKSIPVIYMTGTYLRPLSAFKIPPQNVVIWDYEDLQNGKKLAENDSYFRELYGELYTNALTKLFSYGETLESIAAIYRKFPDLHLLTTQFTEEAKVAFSDQGAGKGFAKIEQLFRLKKGFKAQENEPQTWANGFQNLKGILRLINYLAPKQTAIKRNETTDIEEVESVLQSIDKISQRVGDRLAYVSTDFVVHSQIWFLAHSQTDLLQNRMPALASAIFRNKWFRSHFHVLAVSGVNWRELFGTNKIEIPAIDEPTSKGTLIFTCPNTRESLKQCILREEAEAMKEKKGLIILAQNMLQVGISLPCADIVVLLDTGENVDDRIQKMFRALTESPMKKAGFIVDLNYFRTVKAVMDYQISSLKVKKNKRAVSIQDSKELFNKFMDLYYIDDDKRVLKADIQSTIPEIQSLIEREGVGDMKIENAGRIVNDNIRNVLTSEYDRIYEEFLGSIAAEKEKKRLLREEGKEVDVAENELNSENESEEDSEPPEMPKLFNNSLTESSKKEAFIDIFKTILKLGIFTTDTPTIEELQAFIRDNEEFRDIIYETLARRGDIVVPESAEEIETQKRYLFEYLIIPNLQKIIAKGREGSYANMKGHFNRDENMQGRIDNVLKYINEHLAPKDKERHKFGEVFTPLTLVDEMLSKLPKEVWSNPDLKWLDPANGMGNFPIKAFLGQDQGEHKYPGLFEGLKEAIKDDEKRCKHIIENMLYMVDINGKNNRVARMLFEKLCPDAKANIEQIDKKNGFLSEKPLVFNGKNIDKFDVIMGNPPFQGGAIKAVGTKKVKQKREQQGIDVGKNQNLWIPFVERSINKYLNDDGYLLFIHPIGWFKTHGPFVGVHDLILSKQLFYLNIFKDSQLAAIFGKSANISSAYYLLQNKNSTQKTTIFDINDRTDILKLNKNNPIILAFNSILYKIIEKCPLFKDGNSFQQASLGVSVCSESGPYKNIAGINDKGEILIVQSSKQHPSESTKKLFIDGSSIPKVYLDNGEYGIMGQNQSYFVGDNLESTKVYFQTKLSTFLLRNIKYRQNFIEPRYYPDIRELNLTLSKITDTKLAEIFEFNEEEKEAIDKMPSAHTSYTIKNISCAQLKGEKEETAGGARFNKTRKIKRN